MVCSRHLLRVILSAQRHAAGIFAEVVLILSARFVNGIGGAEGR